MSQTLFHIPIPEFLQRTFGLAPSLPVYGYGLMMVVGFLLAIELAKYLARRSGFNPEIFVNAGLVALVAGVVGARLSHVLENWSEYTDPSRSALANFKDAINISSGGLTYYGGVLLATPATILYGLYHRVNIRLGMDIVAPCLMVGLAFGRVGCFLNGCCYGAECQTPLSVRFPYPSPPYIDDSVAASVQTPAALLLEVPGYRRPHILRPEELAEMRAIGEGVQAGQTPDLRARLQARGGMFADAAYTDAYLRHAGMYAGQDLPALAKHERSAEHLPAQLMSTLGSLLVAAFLATYFTLPHAPGRVFALMLMIEGAMRFTLEMLRVEPPVTHLFGYGLSFSMVLSLLFIPAGALLWYLFGLSKQRTAWVEAASAPGPAGSPAPALA